MEASQELRDFVYFHPSLTKPVVGLADFTAYVTRVEGRIRYAGSEFIQISALDMANSLVAVPAALLVLATVQSVALSLPGTTRPRGGP